VRLSGPPALARTTIIAAALLGWGATGARAQDGSWLEQETATGNWGGARERIVEAGITPRFSYTTDLLANPVGGARQGFRVCGRSGGLARVRPGEAARPRGSSFFIAASWASGRGSDEEPDAAVFGAGSESISETTQRCARPAGGEGDPARGFA
jgi:hypothetical protein